MIEHFIDILTRHKSDLSRKKVLSGSTVHPNDLGMEGFAVLPGPNGERSYSGTQKTGIALFGLGRMGIIHLQNAVASSRVEVLYCVDQDEGRRNYAQFRWLGKTDAALVLGTEDQELVFQDPRVQAVIIATPTASHQELVVKALSSGKAVLCEKPLALDNAGISMCYQVAGPLPLLCAFNRRFDPSLRTVRDKIQSGEIGQVYVIKTCSRDSPCPSVDYLRVSGGIFHDCAVHDIDLVCWILGERPTQISVFAHTFSPKIQELDDYDTVIITLKFPSGVLATIDLSRHGESYGYDQRLEVFGSLGMLTSGGVRPISVNTHSRFGSNESPICYSFSSRYAEAYQDELEHFIQCVQGESHVEVEAKDTLAVERIATACEEAARTSSIVKMNWEVV